MASRQMFPVVMPGERRGSPHSPQLTHTHTHRGHQLGEVGRAGARCPSEPRAPRPAARQGGTPRHPQIPLQRPPSDGGQTPRGARTPSRAPSPASPAPAAGNPHRPCGRRAGSGGAEPSREPRHLLTVTGGASSSHLPACSLAF